MRLTVLIGVVIALGACDLLNSNRQTVEVTVEELVATFDENELAALEQFSGKDLLVSASVQSINVGYDDRPFVNLAWEDTLLPVQASFDESATSFLANLRPGDAIQIRCGSVSEVLGTPMLRECRPA